MKRLVWFVLGALLPVSFGALAVTGGGFPALPRFFSVGVNTTPSSTAGQIRASGTIPRVTLDVTGGTNNALFQSNVAGTQKFVIGVSGQANGCLSGDAAGDTCLSTSQTLRITANNTSSQGASLIPAGNWNFLAPTSGPAVTITAVGASQGLLSQGNATTNITDDIQVNRTGTETNLVGQGSNIRLGNTTASQYVALRHYAGGFCFDSFFSGAWTTCRLKMDNTGTLTSLGGAESLAPASGSAINSVNAVTGSQATFAVVSGTQTAYFCINDSSGTCSTGSSAGQLVLRNNGAIGISTDNGASTQSLPTQANGTYTATLSTGCTTTPTSVVRWQKVGNVVTLTFDSAYNCTSNSTLTNTDASLPAAILPVANRCAQAVPATDNTSTLGQAWVRIKTTSVIDWGFNGGGGGCAGANWTGSGTKVIGAATVTYPIN